MPIILAITGAACMAACQWLIFNYAPLEESMGLVQKIFYPHLALAWWALFSFFVVFCGSILYLMRHSQGFDRLCQAGAEIGVLFSGLALISGMIWARHSWGVWWTWDPRLTATLVMWFIYAGYLVLGHIGLPPAKKSVIRAVMGVVAFLDVPLVFFSARIFRSIHPAVIASNGGGMEPEMLAVALATVGALGIFWLGLLLIRKKQLDMTARLDCMAQTAGGAPGSHGTFYNPAKES